MESAPAPFERLSAAQRTQLRDLLRLALDPAMADLAQARLQAAWMLGSVELD
jgi:hypothetical protein